VIELRTGDSKKDSGGMNEYQAEIARNRQIGIVKSRDRNPLPR